ncbi:MAG: sulfatase-like hydrolase/transferase [Alphaproteobacteria bacterium]|nr:sulfatase-like hydrolase/transferase [Alphaproteobacteria bacterium]MCB9794349.1 sulfatase-like hydrolase/transferase [Alphaproteobacteria bacterium]
MLGFALALGLFDGLRATPAGGEPLSARLGGVLALDLALLAPLAGLAALLGLLRPRVVAPGLRRLALGVLALSALLLARGLRGELDLDALTETWRLSAPLPALAGPDEARPILLISVDTLRHDALEHMPRLRAWSEGALVYPQARAHAPWTLPAMASILTGEPPQVHGAGQRLADAAPHARSALSPELATLAERLRGWGYITAGVLTNPFLEPRFGLTRGLDRAWNLSRAAATRRALRRSSLLRPLLPPLSDDAEAVTDRALRALSRLDGGQYLLWVHYLDPHAPYATQALPPEAECAWPDCFDGHAALRREARSLSEAELERLRALYAADLARLDAGLARLLERVEALHPPPLVLLVADHGEAFGEHGALEHGSSFFDEQVRVPLMVGGAGASGLVQRAVGTRAVFGAALAWAAEEGLGPLGVEGAPQPVALSSILFGPPGVACVLGGHKAIAHEGTTLYDLVADPSERVGITDAPSPEMRACLEAAAEAAVGPDPGGWEGLRGLGYVD